jgi:hypothetical protein
MSAESILRFVADPGPINPQLITTLSVNPFPHCSVPSGRAGLWLRVLTGSIAAALPLAGSFAQNTSSTVLHADTISSLI